MPNINNVPTTQYIGPRIIPHFAEPSEWSITREYDALSIVTNGGNTYWAKTNVPAGIQITNTTYWFLSAYPDAQIQQYREEVQAYAAEVETFDGRIDALEGTASTHTRQITTLQGDVSDLQEDVADLQTIPPAVFIGDSFTSAYYLELNGANENQRWCYPVARAIGATPYIFAERGAGYSHSGNASEGGHTFRGMLDVASADARFDNSDVAWLFVYGGLNDIDHENPQTAFSTNFSAFCTAARSIFPNARIVVCGINAWPEGMSLYSYGADSHQRGQIFYEVSMKGQSAFLQANCSFISMCGALAFNASYYYADNRHPNVLGNEAIATWIISALFGSPITKSSTTTLVTKDGTVTGGSMIVHFQPGLFEIGFNVPSTMNDTYIKDNFNILLDQAIDPRGVPLITTYQDAPQLGYLGDHEYSSEPYGYVHVVKWGYGKMVRAF